jgi:hypothetical protein
MSTLNNFIESLTREKDNLTNMWIIKGSNAHALVVHGRSNTCNPKTKRKGKGKAHAEPKKEGYPKTFDDSSGSKGGKGKKGNTNCGYCNCGYHPESTCMKKYMIIWRGFFRRTSLGITFPKLPRRHQKIKPNKVTIMH